MKNRKLYAAIKATNSGSDIINNVELFDFSAKGITIELVMVPDAPYPAGTPLFKIMKQFKDTPVVIKNTVIQSSTDAQLKTEFQIENGLAFKEAGLVHTVKDNGDPHTREDIIRDDYNYLLNKDTRIVIKKLLPGASVTVYLYEANREILPELRAKVESTLYLIDLLR